MEEPAARAELRLHHPAPGARPHGEVEVVAGVAVHPPARPVQGRGLVPASLDARLDTGYKHTTHRPITSGCAMSWGRVAQLRVMLQARGSSVMAVIAIALQCIVMSLSG